MIRGKPLPDIGLAKKVLGWEPHVQLREGLAKTIAYFDGILRSQVTTKISGRPPM